MGTIQLGLCQMKVTADKAENLRTAEEADDEGDRGDRDEHHGGDGVTRHHHREHAAGEDRAQR